MKFVIFYIASRLFCEEYKNAVLQKCAGPELF
jgi:hypothetical protein